MGVKKQKVDSLILVIMSHGREGEIIAADGKPVKITDIVKVLSDKSVEEIPKFLLIHACRSKLFCHFLHFVNDWSF